MRVGPNFVLQAFIVLWGFATIGEGLFVKFTNLECESFNKSVVKFEKCRLKAVARHNVSLNIHIKFFVNPIHDIKLHAQLLHKGNGFRPLLYNDTLDFCQFMKNPKRWMFWKLIFDAFSPYTNMNHTCPVNHDVIVKDLSLTTDMMQLLPFPPNTYLLRFRFFNAIYRGFQTSVQLTVYN
uniref:MD-2-related lipid-recognition domain-containing protein n=1 Tax=Stomoxys calcitrans TaxID=35570 RepID=A0A1I8Q3Q1_STOCA